MLYIRSPQGEDLTLGAYPDAKEPPSSIPRRARRERDHSSLLRNTLHAGPANDTSPHPSGASAHVHRAGVRGLFRRYCAPIRSPGWRHTGRFAFSVRCELESTSPIQVVIQDRPVYLQMDAANNRNPFQGANRISAILITLFLSFFAIALFYVFYRQFNGGWERPGLINPWRNTFARTLDRNEKPILWDVHIGAEKVKWEWGEFRVSEPFQTYLATFSQSYPSVSDRLISFPNEN